MIAGLDLVQDDFEHPIGAMGPRAHARIGGEQGCQIEWIDGLVDDAGERVDRQTIVERDPFGSETIPAAPSDVRRRVRASGGCGGQNVLR